MDPVMQEFIDVIAERQGFDPEQVALDVDALGGEEWLRSFIGPVLDAVEVALYPNVLA